MVSSKSQKNTLHSLLSTNLKKLTITPPPSSSSSTGTDFDFSDVFGPPPLTPHHHAPPSPSTSASPPPPPTTSWEPPVIHNRSRSFVGPSPRYTTSPPSLPFHIHEELEAEEEDLERNEVGLVESKISESSSSSITTASTNTGGGGGGGEGGGEGQNGKLGPADFEILRVVGRGAFGKVFQVRLKKKKSESGDGDGDGIYAMKVMRKDGIIKKNHVGYMKAERDILTKVVHPFIVQLRFSFQVPPHLLFRDGYDYCLVSFFKSRDESLI